MKKPRTKRVPGAIWAVPKRMPGATWVLAVAALLLAAACEQPPGTGRTAAITLGTATDLAKIGVDAAYPLDGNYTLGADLTLTAPIGTLEEPFTGTFDGGRRTITLAMDLTGVRNGYNPVNHSGGVFAFLDGAVIANLTVAGTLRVIAGDGDDADSEIDTLPLYAGGVAGFAEKGATISSCVSTVTVTVEGRASNSSAGGIAGYLSKGCVIADSHATGNISLSCQGPLLMFHAGGIAGYQGLAGASAGGEGNCVIERCYFTGNVAVDGAFPYGGGIAGYNYAGSVIRQSWAAGGTVSVTGENLPYAGGVSGYNSRSARIENSYAAMTVNAVAASKQALAGGITGANATDSVVSKSYARGTVSATVDGNGTANTGGSTGVPSSANAGGIAGAQYFGAPSIQNCAALNSAIAGADSGSGAVYNVHRIAGPGTGEHNSAWEHNIACVTALTAGSNPVPPQSDAAGYDGETCAAKPNQAAYEELGWDFNSVWKMSGDYPVLQWQ